MEKEILRIRDHHNLQRTIKIDIVSWTNLLRYKIIIMYTRFVTEIHACDAGTTQVFCDRTMAFDSRVCVRA